MSNKKHSRWAKEPYLSHGDRGRRPWTVLNHLCGGGWCKTSSTEERSSLKHPSNDGEFVYNGEEHATMKKHALEWWGKPPFIGFWWAYGEFMGFKCINTP